MKPPPSVRNTTAPFPGFFVTPPETCLYDLLLERLEKRLLVRILSKNQGDRQRTAKYLEMEYSVLREELMRHRLLVRQTQRDS
jgi:DNA-binding NtrC family response regulator